MKVAIRVDSSNDIGTGHVMRCMSLAQQMVREGAEVTFYSRNLPGNILSVLSKNSFPVILLNEKNSLHDSTTENIYSSWIPVTEEVDAEEFNRKCQVVDLIIVDHYSLSKTWETIVHSKQAKIMAIDDLLRDHCADVIIDQTYLRKPEEYIVEHHFDGQVLAGSDYAMLRTEFNQLRECHNRVIVGKHKILITMGGVDKLNATLRVLKALSIASLDWADNINIVLSEKAPHYTLVKKFVATLDDRYKLINFTNDMASLMCEATIAIGAPGTTSWERACLGLPSILIPIAENQLDIASKLESVNASIVIDFNEISTSLLTALGNIKENWQSFSEKNAQICDGLGTKRICAHLSPLKANDGKSIFLKKATKQDIGIVYAWQSEPETRCFSRTTDAPSKDRHFNWMSQKLEDSNCYFYIVHHGEDQAGVIRLDRIAEKSKAYEISIYFTKSKKRLGLAKQTLQLIKKLHEPVDLYATVFSENKASVALFESSGFIRNSETEFKFVR